MSITPNNSETSSSNAESSAAVDATTASILLPSQGGQTDNTNSGLSDGAIAGIVITILLLMAAAGVAVAVVLLVICKRSNSFTFKNSTDEESNFSMSKFLPATIIFFKARALYDLHKKVCQTRHVCSLYWDGFAFLIPSPRNFQMLVIASHCVL